jgi:hypothetical protein
MLSRNPHSLPYIVERKTDQRSIAAVPLCFGEYLTPLFKLSFIDLTASKMSRRADTAARSSIRAKPAVVNGAPRSETNMNGDGGRLPLEPTQGSHFAAGQGMRARCAVLCPTDVQQETARSRS